MYTKIENSKLESKKLMMILLLFFMTHENFHVDGLNCYECQNDECNKNSNTRNCSSTEVCQISWTLNGTLQRGCGNGTLNFSSSNNTYYFRCNDTDLCNNKTICILQAQNGTLSGNVTQGFQNSTNPQNSTTINGNGATWNMSMGNVTTNLPMASNMTTPTGNLLSATTLAPSSTTSTTTTSPRTLNSTAIKIFSLCYSCDSKEHSNCTNLTGQDYSTQCPYGNVCTTKWSYSGDLRRMCSQNLTAVNNSSSDGLGNFETRCDKGNLCNNATLKCFKINDPSGVSKNECGFYMIFLILCAILFKNF